MPYIDPGSGALIFQVIIAAVLSGIFIARRFWTKISSNIATIFKHPKEGKEE